jgi:hypothetical protein
MTPSAGEIDILRGYAMRLIDEKVPFHRGDATYKEVVETTGWIKTPDNPGTTCGFLCHWLMWKLGVGDKAVLNWPDDSRGVKWKIGENISKIWNKGARPFVQITMPYAPTTKQNPLVNMLELGASMGIGGPQPGDSIFIREPGGSPGSEHVFVFLRSRKTPNGVEWDTAEAGQEHGTDAKLKVRTLQLSGNIRGYTKITGNDPIRHVIGWLDLSLVDYDAAGLQAALKAAAAVTV